MASISKDEDLIAIGVVKRISDRFKKTSDNFERANLLREACFVLHQETARDSEDLASLVLDDVLDSYKSVVTTTGKDSVNNYTDRVVSLLKKSRRPIDLSKWAPTLDIDNVPEIVNNKCKGAYEDCKYNEITNEDLEVFRTIFQEQSPGDKLDESTRFNDSISTKQTGEDYLSCNDDDLLLGVQTPSSANSASSRCDLVSKTEKIEDSDQSSNGFPNKFVQRRDEPNFEVKNISEPNPRNPRESDLISVLPTGPSHICLEQQTKINSIKVQTRGNEGFGKNDEAAGPSVSNQFRTAREELTLQNFKKFNNKTNIPSTTQEFGSSAAQTYQKLSKHRNMHNSNLETHFGQNEEANILAPQHCQQNLPLFSYGASKKSLGARRTVQSKFLPPIQNESENIRSNYGQMADDEMAATISDERLKNIEPKMIELISNEIMTKFKPIGWEDIAGLEYAKSTIQEAVVWPMLRPDIFTGLRRPPRGILLFGPPGTGKTLIGKCIASQSNSTFFSISASSLTSKWIGDGEKMVRALFAVAAVNQPSVIFIDEVDSLLCQRSESEHESSRRIKTEFLVQLDGAMTSEEERILIVGATNRPQELDEAARRRFTRRLYIPLPEQEARLQILNNLLRSVRHLITGTDIANIGKLAQGYSGADIESLCREASMEPIRSIPPSEILHFNENEVRPINFEDFRKALNRIRASVSQNDLKQYVHWNDIYGSGASF